jgi:hypothetical protein
MNWRMRQLTFYADQKLVNISNSLFYLLTLRRSLMSLQKVPKTRDKGKGSFNPRTRLNSINTGVSFLSENISFNTPRSIYLNKDPLEVASPVVTTRIEAYSTSNVIFRT